jgi:hypothetical protein
MTEREYAKQQIDILPEEAVALICEFMAFQAYRYGLTTSDSDYLNAIPGMRESIETGIQTPLSECVSLSKVWVDV